MADAAGMTERQLQECVRQLCRLLGCLYWHAHDSRHSPAGFPDCVIVTKDRRIIFSELKSATGKLTPPQVQWLLWLREGGAETHVWRPAQWLDGTIERAIKGA